MFKKIHYIALGTSLLSVAIISIFFFYRYNRKYDLIKPKRGSITEAIYGLGKVKSYSKYDVKLGIMSTVQEVYVHEGDVVKKGDPLIRFTENLKFSSPINGTVTFVGVGKAEGVAPQVVLLSVQDLNDKYIEVSLEQQAALRVRGGQTTDVIFESLRSVKLEGKVKALFPKNDEFLAHIQVDGLMEAVLPGMTADVSIQVGQHENVMLVPLSAVSNGHLIIERNQHRMKIPIKIGGIDGQWAEVRESALIDSDLIVVKTSI